VDGPRTRNLRRWLLEAAAGEEIGAVLTAVGTCQSWADVATTLDRDIVLDFGQPSLGALYAWTASRVIFVDAYDGFPSVRWVPRHPCAGLPELGGAETCPHS